MSDKLSDKCIDKCQTNIYTMYMKEIKVRDFNRDFKAYQGEECVVTRHGEVIGRWTPAELMSDNSAPMSDKLSDKVDYIEKKPSIAELQALADGVTARVHVPVEDDGFTVIGCEDCHVRAAEKVQWEEGEEIRMCKECIRSRYVGSTARFEKTFNKMQNI